MPRKGRHQDVRNHRRYHVFYMWGSHDTHLHRHSTFDRRAAFRHAKTALGRGAQIVLVKKGISHTDMKVIADFSTVGGA